MQDDWAHHNTHPVVINIDHICQRQSNLVSIFLVDESWNTPHQDTRCKDEQCAKNVVCANDKLSRQVHHLITNENPIRHGGQSS